MFNILSKQNLKQTWKGPFAGGSLTVKPCECLSFEGLYTYHWLHFKETSDATLVADGLPPPIPFTSFRVNIRDILANVHSAQGHTWKFRGFYILAKHWLFGIDSWYFHYSTGKKSIQSTQTNTIQPTAEKVVERFKSDLKSFAISAEVGYKF
jgi:hypothetical protein